MLYKFNSMKSGSKKLIRVIKLALDIAWYLNFALAALALSFLVYIFASEEYVDTNIQVHFSQPHELNRIDAITGQVKDVVLETKTAVLNMKMKNTPFTAASSLFLLVAFELLAFAIIYNLRMLFSSLNKGSAFTYKNVVSIRRTAFLVALVIPLQFILYLLKEVIIRFNVPTPQHLSAGPAFDYKIMIIAAILYIVAEVFNSGLELKAENEEFV